MNDRHKLETCSKCGKIDRIWKRIGDIAICVVCYRKDYEPPKRRCQRCGEVSYVGKRIETGVICTSCYNYEYEVPKDICHSCGLLKSVYNRINGNPICSKCYSRPRKPCCMCGFTRRVRKHENGKPVCESCWMKKHPSPKERCTKCHRQRVVHYRKKEIILCASCNRHRYIKTNPSFRAACLIRNHIKYALKTYGKGKYKKALEYGIDIYGIVAHLGQPPEDGKEWHIDHIIPLSSFDLSDPYQIIEAFAPENHRWLEKNENLRKSDRIEVAGEFIRVRKKRTNSL